VTASLVYRQFLITLLNRLQGTGARRRLCFTPDEREPDFASLVDELPWQLTPQIQGDLGHRINHCFLRALEEGADAVVVVGSDSPTLPPWLVATAFRQLRLHDVVIGPSTDGGYYLIGLRQPRPELFVDIAWGSERVFAQTLERIRQRREPMRTALLPRWYDVDEVDDLRRLIRELETLSGADSVLRDLDHRCRQALGLHPANREAR
jgi:rSAM/selenodomain-associated transferase 1